MKAWHHLPALYFLHIPKTAGTSVRVWAEGLFPQDAILPVHHLKPMEELPDEVIRSTRFASGHFGWRYVERAQEAGASVEVFTFLRDVVGLHMSQLGYAPTIPDDVFQYISPEVAEALRSTARAAQDPAMIKYITETEFNVDRELALIGNQIGSKDPYVLHLSAAGAQSYGLIGRRPEVVEVASERLDAILAVGVVEDMAGSFAVLCDRLGLPYLPLGQTLNRSEKKMKPSEYYAELVRRRNEHDAELHRKATNLVAQRKADLLARYGVRTVDDLATPMRLAFLTTDRGVARVSQADIIMADGLVAEGFAERFFYKPFGRWIRWAGKEATLYLPLDRSSVRAIRFEVGATMNDTIRDGLTLSVDGRDIPLTRTYEQWPDGWHLICEATIPAGDEGLQYTALDFEAPEDVATGQPDSMGAGVSWALADFRVA